MSRTLHALQVTIVPRAKFPLGQTVPRVSDARENTRQYTRQYMEALLCTFLAGTPSVTVGHCLNTQTNRLTAQADRQMCM